MSGNINVRDIKIDTKNLSEGNPLNKVIEDARTVVPAVLQGDMLFREQFSRINGDPAQNNKILSNLAHQITTNIMEKYRKMWGSWRQVADIKEITDTVRAELERINFTN